ncbi:Krueppel-like factor 7 isoform X1 [Tachysurus ichikawai]
MISLFPTGRTRPELCLIRDMPALSLPAGTLCLLLPIHTPSVTREPSELHFYSGRHVRDRVRLHLRRVTDNNNDTLGTGETESRSEAAPLPRIAEVYTELTER